MAKLALFLAAATATFLLTINSQPLPHGCKSQCSWTHGHCVADWPAPYCMCYWNEYTGDYCQTRIITLKSGQTVGGFVYQGYWNYFFFNVNASENTPLPKGSYLVMSVAANLSNPIFTHPDIPDLYTQYMHQPNMTDFSCHASGNKTKIFGEEFLQTQSYSCNVTDLSKLTPESVWQMGVYGAMNNTGPFLLTATLHVP